MSAFHSLFLASFLFLSAHNMPFGTSVDRPPTEMPVAGLSVKNQETLVAFSNVEIEAPTSWSSAVAEQDEKKEVAPSSALWTKEEREEEEVTPPLNPAARTHFAKESPLIPLTPEPIAEETQDICYEPCELVCEKRSFPLMGYGIGAAVVGVATAAMLIPHAKTDPESPAPPLEQDIQFCVNISGETVEDTTIHIILPDLTEFQQIVIISDPNPQIVCSNVIVNALPGVYQVNLTGVDNPVETFSVDVIVDGVTVITGAPFTGTPPNLFYSFTYP